MTANVAARYPFPKRDFDSLVSLAGGDVDLVVHALDVSRGMVGISPSAWVNTAAMYLQQLQVRTVKVTP